MRSSIASGFEEILRAATLRAGALAALILLCGAAPAARAQSSAAPAATEAAGAVSTLPAGGLRASDPRSVTTAFEQANRLKREGKTADALKAIDLALKTSPRDPQLRFLYGVIVSEQGRGDEAADVFQQLIEDFPELPEPYNNLAVLRAARGDLDGARRALEAAVRALPDYALAHENLGDVYLRMAARSWERGGRAERGGETSRAKLAMARDLLSKLPASPSTTVPSSSSPSPSSAPGASQN